MRDKKRSFDSTGEPSSNKKLKSDDTPNGSNAPAAGSSTHSSKHTDVNGGDTQLSRAALIAQKQAEITAKVAAMKNTAPSPIALSAPTPIRLSFPISAAISRPCPITASGPTPHTGSPAQSSPVTDDINRRVAEVRRRIAEAQSKLAFKDNPYMSMPQTGKKNRPVEPSQQGTGLKMTAHPLLLDTTPTAPQSKKDQYKPMQPKFVSIKANTRNAPISPESSSSNPYAPSPTSKDTGFDGAAKEHAGRNFRFNPKGKYVALGNQMRQGSQLETLKQRIAESARKAGLDEEFEVDKNIWRAPTPKRRMLNIIKSDSPITIYIQHPIPIPAPGDKNKVALKPLMLTKKERKKLRQRKRAAELQDKRDQIRMGLLPPDAPKVRIANLVKVLMLTAVQDPTRVEARVRREVAIRKHGHEKMNAERKLTDEQRREKVEMKKVEEEKKGVYGVVFKIKTLTDPVHRFKVRKNAEQMNLTGVCIFNRSFNMVYVEGAARFIKNYKRLMMDRIAWTEAARPSGAEHVELEDPNTDDDVINAGKGKGRAEGAGLDIGRSVSLEENKCYLVWEGRLRDRAFSNFRAKCCPTDGTAKGVLGDKLKGYWDQAKN